MEALDAGLVAAAHDGVALTGARLDTDHNIIPAANNGGVKLAVRSREAVCRVEMPGATNRVVDWTGVHAQLLTMGRSAACEWEFLLPSLVVMIDLDGGSAGCEWTDGAEIRKLAGLPPHSILLNPADQYLRFRRRMQRGARVLLLTVKPGDLDPVADHFPTGEVELRQRVDLTDTFLHRMLEAIAEEIERPGAGGQLYRHTLTLLMMTQLMRSASNLARPSKPAYVKGGLPSWRLKRALEILDRETPEMPSLAELASHVGLHPTSFCRAFKQSTGISPHRYLLERRVAHAKEMMADQRLTLTQIALDCGFGTSSQFSVVFRRITGLAPSVYRRSL